MGEAATGVALLIVPSLVGRLLFGEELTGVAIPVAQVTGIALIGLSIACWPGPPRIGMLTYSSAVTLYLAYIGFAGGFTGILLWPAVVLHAILTALLVLAPAQPRTIDMGKRPSMRTLVTTFFGLLLLASQSARAQGVVLPLPSQDQQNITAQLGPGVVGAALPSQPITDPYVYFPLQYRTHQFQVVAGPNTGNVQTLGLWRARRPGGRQAWRFQLTPTLAGFMRETQEGDIIMAALSDSGEGVVIITYPANPFVPKGMQPGETRNYSQQVAVNYLDDPSDQKYSGTINGAYTYVGTYQVTVPAGTFPAILFRVKCEGKVGPAHTQNTGYNFFAPGVGMIAMILEEDVTAFWLFNIDSTTGKVLMSK